MADKDNSAKVTDAGATELQEDALDEASGGITHTWVDGGLEARAPGAAKIQEKKLGGN